MIIWFPSGIFDEDTDNGYMTRGLDSAIKTFQRDNDLKQKTPPIVHTVFIADTDRPAERNTWEKYVMTKAEDKNNA